MRNIVLWSVLASTILATTPAAAQSVPSTIRRVTLFSHQALVQREAKVAVEKGTSSLELEIAPFRIDPDSVSARVQGRGEIVGVQYRREPVAASPREKVEELENKLRALKRSQQELADRRGALEHQAAFLSAFVDFSKVQVPKEIQTHLPSVEELNQTLAFLDTGYAQIHAQRREIDRENEAVEKEMDVVKRELAALGRQGDKTRQFIEIVFTADAAQSVGIEAEYLVQNASWKPAYKVSVPESLDAAQLTTFAQIQQKTGEDWQQVNLTVSTAIPLQGTHLPEADSWVLDVPRVQDLARGNAKRMVMMETARAPAPGDALAMADEEAEGKAAGYAQAARRQSELSFSYELPRSLDLASRDKETALPLMTKTLTGDVFHFAVPRNHPMTFLVLEAQAVRELLPGPLSVHLAGDYVGKTWMAEKRAGEPFTIGLGADRDVRVQREKVTDKIRETRFGTFERDRVIRELAYRLTAENLKKRPVTLNILDSVPVSRTDRVQVRDLSIAPQPTEENHSGREGVMRWSLVLAPGESRTIDIRFAVVYPKDQPPPDL